MKFADAWSILTQCCLDIYGRTPSSNKSPKRSPRARDGNWWDDGKIPPNKLRPRATAFLVAYATISGRNIPIDGIPIEEGFIHPDKGVMRALFADGEVDAILDNFVVTEKGLQLIARHRESLPADIRKKTSWVFSDPSENKEKNRELAQESSTDQEQETEDERQEYRDWQKLEEEQQSIQARKDIGPTTKKQLINARRGQGRFRREVQMLEERCRVTGTIDRRHLRASHIKPWVDSDDAQKLDGNNGLLLAPHVDHLFDRGYISFSESGRLLVSNDLSAEVLEEWGISNGQQCGEFRDKQLPYLAHHRANVFEKMKRKKI